MPPARKCASDASSKPGKRRHCESDGLRNQLWGPSFRASAAHSSRESSLPMAAFLNSHFAQYRVPRFSDTPQIEVVLIDRKDLPSAGAGEDWPRGSGSRGRQLNSLPPRGYVFATCLWCRRAVYPESQIRFAGVNCRDTAHLKSQTRERLRMQQSPSCAHKGWQNTATKE